MTPSTLRYAPIVFSFALVLTSCTTNKSPKAYADWYVKYRAEHRTEVVKHRFKFEVNPVPSEALFLLNNYTGNNETSLDPRTLKEYKSHEYYEIHLSPDNGSDFFKTNLNSEQQYFERVAYFTTYAQKHFMMYDGLDTLDCTHYHLERSYGVKPFQVLMIGFPKRPNHQSEKQKSIIFKDHNLGIGMVKIPISKKSLNNLPNLSI